MKLNDFEKLVEQSQQMPAHEAELFIDLQVRKAKEEIQAGDTTTETKQCYKLFKQVLRHIQSQIGEHTQTLVFVEKSMINGERIRWMAKIGVNMYQRMLTKKVWLNDTSIEDVDTKREVLDLLKQYNYAEKSGGMYEMLEVANEVKLKNQTI